MIIVHHLEHSRSQRILWLLEELSVDYEIVSHARDPRTSLAPPELLELHPLGNSPVIVDGDNKIAESGAIVEYLLDKFDNGHLRPAEDTPEFLQYRYWLHYAEGTFATLMMLSLMVNRIESAPMPFFAKPVAKKIAGQIRSAYLDANVNRNIRFIDATLAASDWFCGDSLTAADIQMSFAVEAALARMTTADASPSMAAFKGRIEQRAGYQRALQKGGPYDLGGITRKSPAT